MLPKWEKYVPRVIAFEVTKRCSFACMHCRAGAVDKNYPDELTTEEIRRIFDGIATISKPVIILTGGEPMSREDVYEIASYGNSLGFNMVMAPCGDMVTTGALARMRRAGIKRLSLSIDGADENTHDQMRGRVGAFRVVLEAARLTKKAGIPFQINTTITEMNLDQLPYIIRLAEELGAIALHPFLLVPTGRGHGLAELSLNAQQYEEVLKKMALYPGPLTIKPTCAPQFFRIYFKTLFSLSLEGRGKSREAGRGEGELDGQGNSITRGCLGGFGFAFVSHTGKVQTCGFLETVCGDLRSGGYNFKEIWEDSPVFRSLRDRRNYKGKCGWCEYHDICGGCRARAHSINGDYLGDEPYCLHVPCAESYL